MEKYNNLIMEKVRQQLELDEDDASHDKRIMDMPKSEVLNRILIWEGIVNYTDDILEIIQEIYNVSLKD